jgi:hypothetical protein
MEFADVQGLQSVGWRGFLDYEYLLQSFLALLLATALGLLIAFHPTTRRMVDTVEEAELPKVMVMYALVGAIVGVTVLEYGLVIGFVVFGLGGLMRFRTDTATTRDTGRLILVTLLGLISGLNLPHFAVLAAVYAWVVIYVFDGHPVYSLKVREIAKERIKDADIAYKQALVALGCKVISDAKSVAKCRLSFVFRTPRAMTAELLHVGLVERVPESLRGELDWEVE